MDAGGMEGEHKGGLKWQKEAVLEAMLVADVMNTL